MAKEAKNKAKKEKKENKTFFKDFKAELKKVTWPTAKQLATKTAVVVVLVILIAAIVFVLDYAFDKGYEFIITQSSKTQDINSNENTESNGDTDLNEGTEEVIDESIELPAVDGTQTTEDGNAE